MRATKRGRFEKALADPCHEPVRGTTRTRRHVEDDDSVPVPTMLTETVVEGPHPADKVLLPLRP